MFKRFKNIYLILTIFIFCCVLIFGKQYIDKIVFAEKSSDAIAIRIIANPEHYSALAWYKEQNFQGSPQSIIVDGYSGIRDSRTVYINVGNISSSNVLYTNIYLISYNQQAKKQTIDIFSQILNHWKFNTNISTIGQCSENNDINCVLDLDCRNGEYCNSEKAKIIRDVNRMENLVELNKAIEKYKNIYNNYPKLSAGSYLPNKTISVWPSWQKVLAQDLAMKLPDDPINKLGDCGDDRFHSVTCWDKDNKEFADSDLIDPDINLPENSRVYVYTTTKSGSSYNICSVMESGYIQGLGNGACDSSESFTESGELINHQPIFINDNLLGIIGNEYNGYIEAIDQDGDELTWTINTNPVGQWASWEGGNPPIIKYLTINNQIMIYSEKSGLEGFYSFLITINDNKGEVNSIATKNFNIEITNNKPFFNSSCLGITRMNNMYSCDVLAVDPDGHSIVSYIFQAGTYPSGLSINNTGNITGSPTQGGNFNIIIVATDEYGATAEFNYNLIVNTYCGDNVKQAMNMEGRGGQNNNGQEDCDNIDGVASSPSDSSENKQYNCTTPPECPQVGDCVGTCEYTGGWCGDSNIDIDHEECDYGTGNTDVPCSPAYNSNCNYCDTSCSLLNIQGAFCGDGSIDIDHEECDYGTGNTDVPCSPAYNSSCNYCDTSCGLHNVQGAFCGDGTVDVAESCDSANLAGHDCISQGFDCSVGSGLFCDSNCTFSIDNCLSIDCSCAAATCQGDTCIDPSCNIVCGGEQICTSCGDGTCDAGESCTDCISDCGACPPTPGFCGVWVSGGVITANPTYPLAQPYEESSFTYFVGNGDYSSNINTFSGAIAGSFDGIAIEPNTRLEMWTGPNFTGIKSFDVTGPALINNDLPGWHTNDWLSGFYNAANCWGYNNSLWENNCFWLYLGEWANGVYDNGSSRITCY